MDLQKWATLATYLVPSFATLSSPLPNYGGVCADYREQVCRQTGLQSLGENHSGVYVGCSAFFRIPLHLQSSMTALQVKHVALLQKLISVL